MRTLYTAQLNDLKRSLTEIGTLCERAICSAMDAFFAEDAEYIETAKVLEQEINAKEKEIEQSCLTMLLHQQPVASDFRNVSAALKMITDVERIGDQAFDIANITAFEAGKQIKVIPTLARMSTEACYMVRKSIDAFVSSDMELARSVIAYDDNVDELFAQVRKDVIVAIREGKEDSEAVLDELMIAKYLERIADHATNIAEWVIFGISGVHESGN